MTEELGRYKILEEIGQGGFAIVYRAHDTELDRIVALKELRPILLQETDWVKRFRREARTIARLDHPHIVTIYDVYESDGRLFIVMRLVDGPGLEEIIAKQGRLPWSETAEIIMAVAKGLDYAHAQGVLHRDLKPANILMDPERGPMLTDFGLAKLAGEASMSVTAGGGVVGTPHYIAPEVWEGRGSTRQSDIYAVGCILFEMLTGEKIFKGETPPSVMMAHFRPLELPKAWPQGVPAGIAEVLKTALANNPGDRYDTTGAMAATLARLAAGKPAEPIPVPAKAELDSEKSQAEAADLVSGAQDRPPDDAELVEEKQSAAEATYVQAVEATAAQLASAQQQAVPAEKPSQQLNGIEASHKGPAAIPPTVAGTLSTTVPRGQVPQEFYGRRRSGCLWVSLAVGVGLILFLVIGAGTFCTAVRGIISAAFPEVEVGETVRETIRIAVPDDIDQVILDITFHGGQLFLAPGAEGALVEGTATYNVDQLKPQVTTSGNGIRLEQQGNIGLSGFTTADIENKWDLKLASVPMALKINTGGAEGDIDLGGLSLVDLEVTQGAASFDLRFSEPNQVDMAALKFTAGAARVHLEGLANARAEEIIFEGGAGDYMLEFSGELRDDLEVSIDGGFSTVSIVVPEQVAARVAVEGERNNVSARGVWQETDNEYVISGDGPKITIDVALDSGNLTLRNP